MRIAMSH